MSANDFLDGQGVLSRNQMLMGIVKINDMLKDREDSPDDYSPAEILVNGKWYFVNGVDGEHPFQVSVREDGDLVHVAWADTPEEALNEIIQDELDMERGRERARG
jgi:hypothetical protein